MSALPIFDETRREFVPAPPAPAPPARAELAVVRTATAGAPVPGTTTAQRDPGDKRLLFQAYLERLKQELDSNGKAEDAAIVADLLAFLHGRETAPAPAADPDHHPIYAVSAAYIAALTMISIDEANAAQLLARKLIVLGYGLPKQGGDTRGWKRLLLWRDQLERGKLPLELREIYDRAFKFAGQAPLELDLRAALDHATGPV